MKMFGLKALLAAGAVSLFAGQAGALTTTLVCPNPVSPDDAVVRYLQVEYDAAASVFCAASGTTWNANTVPNLAAPNDGFVFIAEATSSNPNGLAGLIAASVDSLLYGGNSGVLTFTKPNPLTYGSYGILWKFGANTQVADGWFLLNVAFNQLTSITFDWKTVFDPNTTTKDQWALSHVALYGKDPTTIPLPAGGVLLLTALGGMALVRRRKLVAA
jgi:hypothetical protein